MKAKDFTNGSDSRERLLAVGGTHVFESSVPCELITVKPEHAVQNLEWADALVLEAHNEGRLTVKCGNQTINSEIVRPARLEIRVIDDQDPNHISINTPFKVQGFLYDSESRELEVGKFTTTIEWTCSAVLEVANDPSAGEFGFCDTCYGMFAFRAVTNGKGLIVARFRDLENRLMVEAKT